jgi:hypothetical protein
MPHRDAENNKPHGHNSDDDRDVTSSMRLSAIYGNHVEEGDLDPSTGRIN